MELLLPPRSKKRPVRWRSSGSGGVGDAAAAAERERPGGEVTVKIQSKALRCRICSEPLKPPIFKVICSLRRIPFLFLFFNFICPDGFLRAECASDVAVAATLTHTSRP